MKRVCSSDRHLSQDHWLFWKCLDPNPSFRCGAVDPETCASGPETEAVLTDLDQNRRSCDSRSSQGSVNLTSMLLIYIYHIISSTRGSLGNEAGFSKTRVQNQSWYLQWTSICWIWNYMLWKQGESWEFVLYLAPVSWRSLVDVDGSSLQTCRNKHTHYPWVSESQSTCQSTTCEEMEKNGEIQNINSINNK